VVRADPSQLRQVVLNLVTNARDAVAARGGRVEISARVVDHNGISQVDDVVSPSAGTYLVISVSDDGAGIDPAVRARIFDPFFTTKPSGHGLGLAAVQGIVRSHGGGLRVCASPSGGARFEVWWPAGRPEPTRLPTPIPTPVLNILVVDDEDLVRDVLARMVEDLGYSVIAVADGAEALALADRSEVTLDAVILDLTMPTMSGRTVLTGLRARRPGVPIVLCSGYDREASGPSGDAFLRKPFRMEDLERILADVTRTR
jgi:CheY-like chemotaxis protein